MDAVVGLGANVGARGESLASAARALSRSAEVVSVSSLYETEPIGPPQPDFLNAAIHVRFAGDPRALLGRLLDIEREHGRTRAERWGPRTLDLDLLFVVGTIVSESGLTVPHPGLLLRAFALVPLLEVLPDARHPRTGERLDALVPELPSVRIRRVAGPEWAVPAE